MGSVAHLELKQDLKAEEKTLDLNEFLDLIHVLKNELEIQECLAVLLSLVGHCCDVVNQDRIEVRHLRCLQRRELRIL